MNFKEFIKKYWFVVLVGIVLIAFIGIYTADSLKNREKTVQSKQVDGKYVVYSVDGIDVYADDFFETLYNQQNGMSDTFKQFERKIVNAAYETDDDMSTLASSYASGAYQYYGEDYIKSVLQQNGYTGDTESLKDYYIDILKEEKLYKDYLKANEADLFTPYAEDESPRLIKQILVKVEDVTSSTDENGNTVYTANPTDEEKAKLEEVLEALKEENFDDVQSEYNEDGTNDAYFLSNTTSSSYYAIFSETGLALSDGETSEVVTSSAGYHILMNVGSSIDDLIDSEDFLEEIQNTYPTSFLKAILEKADELGFEIVDESFQEMINNQLESEEEE